MPHATLVCGCLHAALTTTGTLRSSAPPWGLRSHPTCSGILTHTTLAPASPSAWSTALLGLPKAGFPSVKPVLHRHLPREALPDSATQRSVFPTPVHSLSCILPYFL